MRRVRGEAFLALALLNIFVLITGLVALDVIEARPLSAVPNPVTRADGVAAVAPATPTPADPVRIADILDDPMSSSGLEEGLSGYVVDGVTGETLFERDADTPVTPASTTKIATAVAVLDTVGPDHVLRTEAHLDAEENRVVLRGGGDVTLTATADSAAYPQVATLEELAEDTAAALAERGLDTVTVGYDDSLFTGPDTAPGWKPNYVTEGSTATIHALMVDSGRVDTDVLTRSANPPLAAAEAFADQLEQAGLTVEGSPDEAGASGEPVASVDSMPMSALVEFMMLASDNNMAESLGRITALETGEEPDHTGAATATHRALEGLGIEGVQLSDNSGLSTKNRITPRALVQLVKAAADEPRLNATITGLPTAHSTGTLAGRYSEHSSSHAAAGLVRGKTGTLDGVSTLAGTIHDQEGNVFVFALMANSPGASGPQLDTLATALSQCGCG
ncbi:D-alanyl-D-alanine carboxypeptidase/D-alanyl-D-alanine-endopeptidase [Nocardiopsis sp. L17-MgMaSL7]|uniref:D-alanyl-D-alanine carboxypeptidase/D-alanyl-D-alanine endopeptidase n=1 Tax=Nocardiopsis sp. L17-MgMaSL7 TaxID=1938893 RepID=UPI000D864F87|nr:D-alanyl-D-alanine carboxypeptidase/D-alanyl-D-alanine-endopeptidase [Nocardiopsis sp. L17-MgMaSL7]PWV51101.1 D-alanyl-D-alanine carboxypeptidase/D-alanyl-D-alanine-endopeptidase (penicillin-binding protein 4) [Nocardiopsis sp. L17-MgMaSL7]